MTMLEARNLNASHSGARVLWDVCLQIQPGETFALLGRNGAGKTTLLRTLMGLHPLDSGELRIAGEDGARLPAYGRAAIGVAYVPQGRGIFPKLTVQDNLRLAPGDPRIALDAFPKLAELRGRLGGNLSGGEQQQLAVGRALMMRPKLLILDEPAEGVQPSVVQQIEERLCAAAAGEQAP
ncbi:MAG: ATP-binding cassette domain-containing protein, partial [Acidobacteria bacterium]|nr:ATP-binding cassette domain-containing protein [Acidobacteriota bacterium]